MSRRSIRTLLLAPAALVTLGAAPDEEQALLAAFDAVLTAMVAAAAGLGVFAIVWAGFLLMAEDSEQRSTGRARNAVLGAVCGLVLVLSAKGLAAALLRGLVPLP